MSKFLVQPTSTMLGTTCFTCGTHKHDDGFVNTSMDVVPLGRICICAGCVREMARTVGCLSPDQVAVLHGQLDELAEVVEKTQADLRTTKDNMVVPLAEVIDFVRERERRRPDAEPVAPVA